ncbi:MAG: hypothetical protein M3256_22375 [Actinomycetota bacterium]|nr:hypothetical protein [Actinomycetota bacterium]
MALVTWVQLNREAVMRLRSTGQRAIDKSVGGAPAEDGIAACQELLDRLPELTMALPVPDPRADTDLGNALQLYKFGAGECIVARSRDDQSAMLAAHDNLVRADREIAHMLLLLG